MKKNRLLFLIAFLIVLFTSNYAFSFDVKNIIDSAKGILGISKTTTAKPAPAVAKPPAQSKAKAPAQSPAKPATTLTDVSAQGKNQPAQAGAANVPVAGPQIKPAPAGTTVPGQDKNQAVSAAPLGAATSPGVYSYNPVGKPDPFNPFITVEKSNKKKSEKKAPTSIFPLQRAEADSYRVVGIAGTEEKRVAIVEDTAKKFYPLIKGTRIGLNNGKVTDILVDRVIVDEEEVDDNNKTKKAKRVILKLRKN